MAKRFTDSEKWAKPWFRGLPNEYKHFWTYLLDACDHAGIWYVDMELAVFCIGLPLDKTKALELFEKQITVFDGGKRWFIKDYIPFQYGKLTKSRFHVSITSLLKKFRIPIPKGYGIPYGKGTLGTPKVKDKDIKDVGVKTLGDRVVGKEDFERLWAYYPKKDGKKLAYKAFQVGIKNETDLMRLTTACENYVNYVNKAHTEFQYIKNGSTFFNNWEDWEHGTDDSTSVTDFKALARAAREAKRAREESDARAVFAGVRDTANVSESEGRGSAGESNP